MQSILVLLSVLGLSMAVSITEEYKYYEYEDKDVGNIFLDCPYTVDAADNESLSVKWYYGRHGAPIYSWTWGYAPEAYGEFKDYIDTSRVAVPGDTYSEFRGIEIVKPVPHLSGSYKCEVTTNAGYAEYTQEFFIWSRPEMSVSVERTGAGDDHDSLVMTYSATGMYPEPSEWQMWWMPLQGNEEGRKYDGSFKFDRVETEWMEGYYSSSYRIEVPRWKMMNGDSAEFGFSVTMDRVGQTWKESTTYHHVGSGAASVTAASALVVLGLAAVNRA